MPKQGTNDNTADKIPNTKPAIPNPLPAFEFDVVCVVSSMFLFFSLYKLLITKKVQFLVFNQI
jgi:hypothetical protein